MLDLPTFTEGGQLPLKFNGRYHSKVLRIPIQVYLILHCSSGKRGLPVMGSEGSGEIHEGFGGGVQIAKNCGCGILSGDMADYPRI